MARSPILEAPLPLELRTGSVIGTNELAKRLGSRQKAWVKAHKGVMDLEVSFILLEWVC